MAALTITEYTDPACPFAWSAEPYRWRLRWLYGDQLDWQLRMIGLAEDGSVYEEKGFTAERMAQGMRQLAHKYHMPMDSSVRPRVAGTVPACRAVVAVRRHQPELEAAMLRALRVLHFSGRLLDEPATLAAAAERVGIDSADLDVWLAEPETEMLLRQDMEEARTPSPGALALAHKLAPTATGHRYTCPSYDLVRDEDGASLSVPGFQPVAAYEVAVANLAPEATRREDPDDVREVLDWAGEPLATIEVATICATDLDDARERLGRVADEVHLGFDGLWHLNGVAAVA
ncbi:MAG TPA: DsbA family protein [Solirubrobacteraceae bacterium]|jgi:predicted DsbA family dithiol-disulfide isomerase